MLDNISYLGRKNDTVRSQFNTIEEMKNFNPNYLSDMYIISAILRRPTRASGRKLGQVEVLT